MGNQQPLIEEIQNAFLASAGKKNRAINKIYKFSKSLENFTLEEKEVHILPFLQNEHIYVKYWGAIIALSHKVFEIESLRALLGILDIPVSQLTDETMSLNLLKWDIETYLYQFYKTGKIGSYPNQNGIEPTPKNSGLLANTNKAIRYFRKKVQNA